MDGEIVVSKLSGNRDSETRRTSRAELGIIADPVDSSRLECSTVRPDRLVVILPAGHPLGDRDQVAFSACLDYPFLGFTQGNPLQEHLSGQTQPLGLRPRYRAHLPSADAICAAGAAGVVIAVVPALAAAQWPFRHLHIVDLSNGWAHRNLLLCYCGRLKFVSPAAEFIAHLTSLERATIAGMLRRSSSLHPAHSGHHIVRVAAASICGS